MTQREMWEATGITRESYLYLEHGMLRSPSIRALNNRAIVLGCKLEDLIEPEWRRWLKLDDGPPRPKHPERLWGRGRQKITSSTSVKTRASSSWSRASPASNSR
jgi:DNA-binding XRE family transcriptional regulator